MNRETKAHYLPPCPAAAELWYYKTSYWPSSNSKGEYIPISEWNVKERMQGNSNSMLWEFFVLMRTRLFPVLTSCCLFHHPLESWSHRQSKTLIKPAKDRSNGSELTISEMTSKLFFPSFFLWLCQKGVRTRNWRTRNMLLQQDLSFGQLAFLSFIMSLMSLVLNMLDIQLYWVELKTWR